MKAIIGHIILNVKNFSTSEPFYDKLLLLMGFQIDHMDQGDYGQMKSYKQGEHNLWIRYDKQNPSQDFVRNVGLDHIALHVDNKAEVDQCYDVVKALKVEITRAPKVYPEYSKNYYAFFFRDPNGIPLEIYFE